MLFKIKSYTYGPIEIDCKIHSNTHPMALSVSPLCHRSHSPEICAGL